MAPTAVAVRAHRRQSPPIAEKLPRPRSARERTGVLVSLAFQVVPARGWQLAGLAVRDEGPPRARDDHADAAAAESRRRLDAGGKREQQDVVLAAAVRQLARFDR